MSSANILLEVRPAWRQTCNMLACATYEDHEKPIGKTIDTGNNLVLRSRPSHDKQRDCTSVSDIFPVSTNSPAVKGGRPNHGRKGGGNRNWSNKQRPSRFEIKNVSFSVHSSQSKADGEALGIWLQRWRGAHARHGRPRFLSEANAGSRQLGHLIRRHGA